jgi:hypothetical protein
MSEQRLRREGRGEKSRLLAIYAVAAALAAAAYLFASSRLAGIGFPLDDAWIHQTYARSLGERGEWAFIPGQPSAGSTAPLWTGMLAVGYALGVDGRAWAFILGWLCLTGTALAGARLYLILSTRNRSWYLGVGLFLILEYHLTWAAVSGMETILQAWLALLVIGWAMSGRKAWFWLGVVAGASVWVRPDGVSLLGPAVCATLLAEREWGKRIRGASVLLAGFALIFGAYLGWNQHVAGDWWPNTYFAKQAEYAVELSEPLASRVWEQVQLPLIGAGILLLPGFLLFVASAMRRRAWIELTGPAWCLGWAVLYALRLPVSYQHGRYLIPMMPVYFICGLAGAAGWAAPDSANLWRRVVSRTWRLAIIAGVAGFAILGARAYARDVAFIETEMIATARWVEANLPEDAMIAAHDIGALGFFAPRVVIDMAGLISPEVIPFIRDESRLADYLNRQETQYLITFPGWYPQLVRCATILHVTGGRHSQAFDGENMTVYRWEGDCR